MKKSSIIFLNARIIGSKIPIERGWLKVKGNLIHSYGDGEPSFNDAQPDTKRVDCQDLTLLPGFIDLHTHGALGCDFVSGTMEEMEKISEFYASHGVTSYLASTYSASHKEIVSALHTIQNSMRVKTGARILGVHLEGPWLNASKTGAQDVTQIRIANPVEAIPYLDSGIIRLITIAPEIKENLFLIKECQKRGITVSAGHTNADYDELVSAVEMGITQITHCFNAMSPLNHRKPGVVGAALLLPQLRCELIADNIHVHPAIMKLLVNTKTPKGVILVTDSISAAGMPDGEYTLEGQKVVCINGTARLLDGTLAGSTLTMDIALVNLLNAAQRPLEDLWTCSSYNAAKSIQMSDHKGKIASSYDADLILLDSNLHVLFTMVEGQVVFDKRL